MLLLAVYGVFAFISLYIDKIPKHYEFLFAVTYTYVEYLFFTIILFRNISTRLLKNLIIAFSVAFLVFQVVFYLQGTLGRIDSIPVGIESILLFIYVFFFFYEIIKSPKQLSLGNHHCFWIALGILVYLGGSFFLNILANELADPEWRQYWPVTYIAEIAKNLLFCVAIIVYSPSGQNNRPLPQNSSSIPHLI